MEKLLHEKEVAGASAWNRLFDETIANMKVKVGEEEVTVSAALNGLSDRDRAKREASAKGVSAAFAERVRLFTLITNTLAKDKEIEDKWRHYPRPGSYRNRSNMVEDEVVDALVSAVRQSFPRLSHRYYAMKAKWLGLEKLQHWDRNAPLPDEDDRLVPWPEAVERVLNILRGVQPGTGAGRPALLRQAVDRCGAAAGQGVRRLRASDGAVGASVSAAELPRQGARRDDAGA